MKFLPLSSSRFFLTAALLAALAVFPSLSALSQETLPPVVAPDPAPVVSAPASSQPARFTTEVRAVDAVTLMSGRTAIKLWGVEKIESKSAVFDLKARTALDNVVGTDKVACEAKGRQENTIFAQCTSARDQDLSLFMIQQGFAVVDRGVVYGSVFEDPYVQAEMQAQERGVGLWGEESHTGESGGGDGLYMASFGFILFLCVIAAFAVLSVIIMRGFQKVVSAQTQNIQMMNWERKLREKERGIVAIMLDTELKANKSKIEAYLVVYEEMLRSLKEPDRAQKYKRSGDIIQKQPALMRVVFDRNTDKLDTLGAKLSSELIHFYARIKSSPDYINLEPTTVLEDAIAILEGALNNARRLDEIAKKLLASFAESGIISEDFRE